MLLLPKVIEAHCERDERLVIHFHLPLSIVASMCCRPPYIASMCVTDIDAERGDVVAK